MFLPVVCCRAPVIYNGSTAHSLQALRSDIASSYRSLCSSLGEPERTELTTGRLSGADVLGISIALPAPGMARAHAHALGAGPSSGLRSLSAGAAMGYGAHRALPPVSYGGELAPANRRFGALDLPSSLDAAYPMAASSSMQPAGAALPGLAHLAQYQRFPQQASYWEGPAGGASMLAPLGMDGMRPTQALEAIAKGPAAVSRGQASIHSSMEGRA